MLFDAELLTISQCTKSGATFRSRYREENLLSAIVQLYVPIGPLKALLSLKAGKSVV